MPSPFLQLSKELAADNIVEGKLFVINENHPALNGQLEHFHLGV